MNRYDRLLERLATQAREEAGASGSGEAPFGFATRVLAEAGARREAPGAGAWERLALGALPIAAALVLTCWLALPAGRAAVQADAGESLAAAMLEEALSQ
jgi:hypothetical protein